MLLGHFFNVPNMNDNMKNETVSDEEVPNEKARQFYDELISANQLIYEGQYIHFHLTIWWKKFLV